MTHPTAQNMYPIASGTSSTSPFIEVFEPRDPTASDINYKVQQRWWNTVSNIEWILTGFTTISGYMQAIWLAASTGVTPFNTITGNIGPAVSPIAGNINVVGDGVILQTTGNVPGASITIALAGVVPPLNGGTGVSNPPLNTLPIAQGAGNFSFVGPLTSGQVLIGATGLAPVPNTLTPGPGISITNGPGTIVISSAGAAGGVVTSVAVDAFTPPGTNPVLPSLPGTIGISGSAVPALGIPVQTDSLAVNSFEIEVQVSSDQVGSLLANAGLASFNAAQFVVDANGFVSAIAGPGSIDITPNTGVNVTNDTFSLLATDVAAVGIPAQTNGTAANSIQVEIQRSSQQAASAAANAGLSSFDSSDFAVDANGFVTLAGAGSGQTITGDAGGPLSPILGNWNIIGGTGITTTGVGNTLTIDATGAGSSPNSFLAYLPVIDNNVTGAGTIYAFGTNTGLTEVFDIGNNFTPGPVAGGAFFTAPITGVYHFDAALGFEDITAGMSYSVMFLNINGIDTYSFEQLNPAATGFANIGVALVGAILVQLTAGDIVRLTVRVSGGGGDTLDLVAPTGTIRQCWFSGNLQSTGGPFSGTFSVTGQTFTAPGAFTYTPTAGMVYVEVELIGGGGGSGGTAATGGGTVAATGGGSAGSYVKFILTAAQVGVSLAGSVGAAGVGGAAGNNPGTAGLATTLATGAAWTAGGGVGSVGSPAAGTRNVNGTALSTFTAGTGTTLVTVQGNGGGAAWGVAASTVAVNGAGGNTIYGFGGASQMAVGATSFALAANASLYGAGAGGAASVGLAAAVAGAAGTSGIAIFKEYVIV